VCWALLRRDLLTMILNKCFLMSWLAHFWSSSCHFRTISCLLLSQERPVGHDPIVWFPEVSIRILDSTSSTASIPVSSCGNWADRIAIENTISIGAYKHFWKSYWISKRLLRGTLIVPAVHEATTSEVTWGLRHIILIAYLRRKVSGSSLLGCRLRGKAIRALMLLHNKVTMCLSALHFNFVSLGAECAQFWDQVLLLIVHDEHWARIHIGPLICLASGHSLIEYLLLVRIYHRRVNCWHRQLLKCTLATFLHHISTLRLLYLSWLAQGYVVRTFICAIVLVPLYTFASAHMAFDLQVREAKVVIIFLVNVLKNFLDEGLSTFAWLRLNRAIHMLLSLSALFKAPLSLK